MNEVFVKRAKSFAWRTGMMVLAALAVFLVENASELNIPGWGVVIIGLVGGEISKAMNTKTL